MAPYHLLVAAAVVAATASRSNAVTYDVRCPGTSECTDVEYVECGSRRWYCPWSGGNWDIGDMANCRYGVHGCVQDWCGTAPISVLCEPIPTCGSGYTYDATSKKCEDIDECATNTHTCLHVQTCRNVPGGFRCECPSGFRPTSLGCEDIDECARPFGRVCCSNSVCINNPGSYECQCKPGFEKGPNGRTCIDINECVTNTHDCRENQTCVNTNGGFTCKCPFGYRMSASKECVDINECTSFIRPVCRGQSRCINTPGSYLCQCNTGFKRGYDAHSCIDQNECQEDAHDCEHTCINLWGSFRCACHTGFRLAEDGRSCVDQNECQENSHNCKHTCINLWGSYRCDCHTGFHLAEDGCSCVEDNDCKTRVGGGCTSTCAHNPVSCMCPDGFILSSDRRSCRERRDCTATRRGACVSTCVHNQGSCTCPDSIILNSDRRSCHEMNACEQGNVCQGKDEVCVNMGHSYRCSVAHCPPGYSRDLDRKSRCKRDNENCSLDPIACREEPLSVTYNYVILPHNISIPSTGQQSVFQQRGPRSGYSSVDFNLELVNATTSSSDSGVELATREHFFLERTNSNEAMVYLLEPLEGPQDVELDLKTTIFHNSRCSGSALSKIFIFVSEGDS